MTTTLPSILAMLNTLTGMGQRLMLLSYARGSESGFYLETLEELRQRWNAMPETYQSGTDSRSAVAHFHFFLGSADWWIVEKDKDLDEEGQLQAFGLASLGYGSPELGYISLPEILAAGAELDLHWTPKSLAEITGRCMA